MNNVDAALDLLLEDLWRIESEIDDWGDPAEESGAYAALRAVRESIATIREAANKTN